VRRLIDPQRTSGQRRPGLAKIDRPGARVVVNRGGANERFVRRRLSRDVDAWLVRARRAGVLARAFDHAG
jgi:hypothetical protein